MWRKVFMSSRRRFAILTSMLLLFAAPLAAALSEATPEDLDQNRRLLEKIRSDPYHYRVLRRDLTNFNRLRPEVRERLRRLDRDVRAELSGTQVRLLHTAQQY